MNSYPSVTRIAMGFATLFLLVSWSVGLFTMLPALRAHLQAEMVADSTRAAQAAAAELGQEAALDDAQLASWLATRAARDHWMWYELQGAGNGRSPSGAFSDDLSWPGRVLRGERPDPVWQPVRIGGDSREMQLGVVASSPRIETLAHRVGLGIALMFALSISLLMGGLLILWHQMKVKLLAMEAQARGLIERDYIELQEPEIEDLRPLARALNVMVVRVRAMLEQGEREVAQIRERMGHDVLTRALTRPAFIEALQRSLQQDDCGGVILVHANDIDGLNLRLGRKRTDDLLVALATTLRTRLMLAVGAEGFVLARLNGADFGVLLPGLVPESVAKQAALVEESLQVLSEDGLTDVPVAVAVGAARYVRNDSVSDVMARADSGLGIAIAGRRLEVVDASPQRHHSLGIGQWRTVIERALEAGRVSLVLRDVVSARGAMIQHEGQVQLQDPQLGNIVSRELLPAAIRCGRGLDIGIRTVELALQTLPQVQGPLAIGVVAQCLEHPVFLRRLEQLLQANAVVAPRLVLELELSEASSRALRGLARLAKAVEPFGCSLALGDLGTQVELLSVLDQARLRHVRLSAKALAGLARQPHRKVFVKLLCEMGAREGFAVLGPDRIDVEDQAVLFALGGAGVLSPAPLAASA